MAMIVTLEDSYAFCRRISRRARSSFHAGFRLLPGEQRRGMEALYAFLRFTDDLADEPAMGCSRLEAVAAWRVNLQQALGEGISPVCLGDGAAASILPAICDAVRQFHIPSEHLFAVLDGVEMDLRGQSYETFDQLRLYCERVASAVGLACIHVWGYRGPDALGPAASAGIALQLTNILRDLRDDAAAGRIYLPAEDLRACGYSAADLRAGVADGRFRRLMSLELARAESFYREAAELYDWLDVPGRRIFGLMMGTYRAVLRTIARRPEVVFRRRIRLTSLERVRLFARWWLLPPRKESLR
jgi:15-cis-phytoene synthase